MLRREDRYVLRQASDFEVDVHRKNDGQKRTCKREVEDKGMKVGLSMEDSFT